MPQDQVQRNSPLHDIHLAAGASFTDFAGWNMPVRYGSDLAEHNTVRNHAGLFDISHMAEFRVTGQGSAEYLDYALAGRLSGLAKNQAKYSLLLAETGGIIDDVIVYRLDDTEFLIISNAGNRFPVQAALQARATNFEVTVVDESEDWALIALQGPAAEAILLATTPVAAEGGSTAITELKYYRYLPASFAGVAIGIARTGYTGEDGFELLVPVLKAGELWQALTVSGAEFGLIPAGLAARDTLRLEAGMPLYGHELGLQIKPAEAGLGRVVVQDKPDFVGKAALAESATVTKKLVGLAAEGKRAARAGYSIFSGDKVVGEVTSGVLSPTLGHPIAMAFVDSEFAEPGTELDFDVRGSRIPARVVQLPFYKRQK